MRATGFPEVTCLGIARDHLRSGQYRRENWYQGRKDEEGTGDRKRENGDPDCPEACGHRSLQVTAPVLSQPTSYLDRRALQRDALNVRNGSIFRVGFKPTSRRSGSVPENRPSQRLFGGARSFAWIHGSPKNSWVPAFAGRAGRGGVAPCRVGPRRHPGASGFKTLPAHPPEKISHKLWRFVLSMFSFCS